MAELQLHGGEPSYAIAVHPKDTTLIASAGGDNKAVLFRVSGDAEEGLSVEIVAELAGQEDTVEHVRFSHDGCLLATGGLDGLVIVWRVEGAQIAHRLEGATETSWLAWHPRDATLAVGSADGCVWIWDAESGECQQVLSGNAATSTCGAFAPDGRTLVTAGDGAVFVWDLEQGAAIVTYGTTAATAATFPAEAAVSLAVSPSKPVAMVGFADGHVAVVHLQHHQLLYLFRTSEQSVEHVDFVPSVPVLLTATLDGALATWDANNYRPRATISDAKLDGITACCWLRQAGCLAVGCLNGSLAVLNVLSGEKMALFPAPAAEGNAVFAVAEIGTEGLLLGTFDDGKIRIYRR